MKKHKPDSSPRIPQREKISQQITLRPFQWTPKQEQLIKLSLDKETKIIFVSGPAGSSKSLISVYATLTLLNERKISDILYIRSPVESSDVKLGYLPGEVSDKMSYYGIPFIDKLGELLSKTDIDKLVKEFRIDIQPVNFVRGQNWNAKGVIIDESQNITQRELITVLTRLGKFAKCFVLGDFEQSDINKPGAFKKMCDLFNNEESKSQGIHYFEFNDEDIMRSELVKFLVKRFRILN